MAEQRDEGRINAPPDFIREHGPTLARFAYLRDQRPETQRALAAALGVTRTTIQNWDRWRTAIDARNYRAIAGHFGVTEDWLETGDQPMRFHHGDADRVTLEQLARRITRMEREHAAEIKRLEDELLQALRDRRRADRRRPQ